MDLNGGGATSRLWCLCRFSLQNHFRG